MDVTTGKIYDTMDGGLRAGANKENLAPMVVPPNEVQRRNRKISRNDPCPCGSKIKFKKCCYRGV